MFRVLLLAAAVYFFAADRDRLDYTRSLFRGLDGLFLWVVWISLAADILYRLIPNRKIAAGARKHFAGSYDAARPVPNAPERPEKKQPLHRGVFLTAAAWAAVTGLFFLICYGLGVLTPAAAVLAALLYAVCDLVFILFFCPFRVLFMRNRCCTVCRVYNWDCFMMCAPLILFPHVYSASLFILSAAVLFLWERAVYKNPHFFRRETNKNLRCDRCEEKLCTFLKTNGREG